MRFGYVLLGLVTLTSVHISSGEYWVLRTRALARLGNPAERGGDAADLCGSSHSQDLLVRTVDFEGDL